MKNRIEKRVIKIIENADILDKRAYLTVDCDGIITRKNINLTIPAMVFCKDDTIFQDILEAESNKIERIKEKKIDRLSNISLEKLKENFIKLVIKGELEFSKRYGKELALRDKDEFIKSLFNLALMDNIKFNKPLLALAMKEIVNTLGWVDEIGYLVISYFTKQRYDLGPLENAEDSEVEILEVPEIIELVAYKRVLDSYSYKNEKKYRNILLKATKEMDKKVSSEIDNQILDSIKF